MSMGLSPPLGVLYNAPHAGGKKDLCDKKGGERDRKACFFPKPRLTIGSGKDKLKMICG
jgi:hypothetical protein